MGTQSKTIAVVLAGAVAKGAFEAGAIQALVRTDVKIARIVAASAGALNGTVLAAAVRARSLVAGADALAALWRDHAEWNEVFHVSFRDLLKRDGLSDQNSLLALLRAHIPPTHPDEADAPDDVNLRLVVATLRGRAGSIGAHSATTFESICEFDTGAFAARDRLEQVFAAATASAALPMAFAPVELPGLGPCVDGGTVNNTPMKWALDGAIGSAIDAVVVIATSVAQATEPPPLGGVALVGHFAEMLIDERLYRDLREAEQVNAQLAALDALVAQGLLDAVHRERVKQALGWTGRRVIPVIQIRPTTALRGTAFSGFVDEALRREYLDAGFERGLEVLGGLGWALRPEPASVRHDDVVGVAADAVVLPRPIERDRAE
jgi:NTE family protein